MKFSCSSIYSQTCHFKYPSELNKGCFFLCCSLIVCCFEGYLKIDISNFKNQHGICRMLFPFSTSLMLHMYLSHHAVKQNPCALIMFCFAQPVPRGYTYVRRVNVHKNLNTSTDAHVAAVCIAGCLDACRRLAAA